MYNNKNYIKKLKSKSTEHIDNDPLALTYKQKYENNINNMLWWINKNYKNKKIRLNIIRMMKERNILYEDNNELDRIFFIIALKQTNLNLDWIMYMHYKKGKELGKIIDKKIN